MPSEKRARQRAAREQKQAVIEKDRKRRRYLRRGLTLGVVAALIVLIVFLVSGSGKKNAGSTTTTKPSTTSTSSSTSTSTSTTVTSTTFATPVTQPLTTAAVVPTCPPARGSAKRVVWFTKAPPACITRTSVFDATFNTSVGKMIVRMPAASSFAAVNNFVFLTR